MPLKTVWPAGMPQIPDPEKKPPDNAREPTAATLRDFDCVMKFESSDCNREPTADCAGRSAVTVRAKSAVAAWDRQATFDSELT
jgi:hypothetical protein